MPRRSEAHPDLLVLGTAISTKRNNRSQPTSLADLAGLVESSKGHLSGIEAGRVNVTILALVDLFAALTFSPEEIANVFAKILERRRLEVRSDATPDGSVCLPHGLPT